MVRKQHVFIHLNRWPMQRMEEESLGFSWIYRSSVQTSMNIFCEKDVANQRDKEALMELMRPEPGILAQC